MTNNIAVIFAVERVTSVKFLRVSCLRVAARNIAPMAPTLAASVGVATPIRIDPSTKTIKNSGGKTTLKTRPINSPRLIAERSSGGMDGIFSG